MPVEIANQRGHALKTMLSHNMVRLRDPKTKTFLHLSGTGTTTDKNLSWLGYPYQAQTLQQQAKTRGEDWPFRPIARTLLEGKSEVNK